MQHTFSREDFERLVAEVHALRQRERRRGKFMAGLAGLAALALVTSVVTAGAQSGSLHIFSSGEPARAGQVNDNFRLLKQWIESKTGSVNSQTLTLADGVVSSSDNAFRVRASGSTDLLTVAPAKGLTTLRGGLRLSCPSCGSASAVEGNANWGTLVMQGRVVSASSNLILSPAGGKSVIISSGYRAAGGSTSGAAGLNVEGDLDAPQNELKNCGWAARTFGTSKNEETLSGICPDGKIAAGYRRWHGNFDIGIETLELYCCEL